MIVVPQIAATPKSSGYGFGYSTTQTGLLLMPMAVVAALASWIGGRSVDRLGPRALMAIGSAAGLVGYLFAAVAHTGPIQLTGFAALIGVTFGCSLSGIWAVVVRSATPDKVSIAAGVNGVVRMTGAATATAAASAAIIGAGLAGAFPAESGFTNAFITGAIACAIGIAASVLLPGQSSAAYGSTLSRPPAVPGSRATQVANEGVHPMSAPPHPASLDLFNDPWEAERRAVHSHAPGQPELLGEKRGEPHVNAEHHHPAS
jgi:MFS family permease